MGRIIAVARNTFLEAIRDRVLYGFLFFAVSLILFSVIIGQLSINEEVRAVIDIGMGGISLFAVLMAIFLSISLFHKEIDKRTLYTIMARPISRSVFLIGKFLGLCLTMLTQIILMSLVWFGILALQGATIPAGIAAALLLITVETVLIIAMALFFTSFSSPFLSGLFTFGIFAAGRGADLLMDLAKRESMASLAPLLKGASLIIPNFYLFYPSGKMIEGSFATVHAQFISSGYLFSTIGYGLAFAAFFLSVATLLLNRRDFV